MNIALFGGSGRTGHELIGQALEQGHTVQALIRTPEKLGITHARLTVIRGNAENREDVFRTVEGTDAVVMALGHTKTSNKDILEKATSHVVAAMHEFGVKRVINLTGATVKVPKDVKQKFMSRFAETLMKTLASDLLRDSYTQKGILEASGLDWTVVRCPRLSEGPKTEQYRTGYFAFDKLVIDRADVAHFMLDEIETRQYVHDYPLIGN
ncbi:MULTISPECIES: NAD(P)-dependent oxidoreductase [Exiguobacterium]|uniref:NAD(P)-dependent oxidoreductase n=1 Tax=Exiguobacterium TaxID=33986 RepID=UPI0008776390|nr:MULTISPECIES: NAD(P)H-binding protein [Exiguobacterium]TCI48334.1 NAD-dependent epimerase/dehydratase family protein [Exiguobacterium sp. SH5S32]TCI55222.1 NAD-dependent epimerase/dehydratase family protein [Exiguobacterium sp. SH1S4]TCI75014.1 NAD-dependent epimerase/dehydratase family protein [Exiguobacterium sp. SH1S1]